MAYHHDKFLLVYLKLFHVNDNIKANLEVFEKFLGIFIIFSRIRNFNYDYLMSPSIGHSPISINSNKIVSDPSFFYFAIENIILYYPIIEGMPNSKKIEDP